MPEIPFAPEPLLDFIRGSQLPQEWPGSVQLGPGVRTFTADRMVMDLIASPLFARGVALMESTGDPRIYGPRDALAVKALFALRLTEDYARGVDSFGEEMAEDALLQRFSQIIEFIKAPVYYWHDDMLEAALTMPMPSDARQLWEPGSAIWLWNPTVHPHATASRHVGVVIFYGGSWDTVWDLFVSPCPEAGESWALTHNFHVGTVDSGHDHANGMWESGLVGHGVAFIASRVAEVRDATMTRQERRDVERNAKNRLERQSVSVITLRRLTEHHASNGDASPRDWASRWWVSGHWRDQPVGPGHADRRPTWIEPYVKGPEGKPVRIKGNRVFDVRQ